MKKGVLKSFAKVTGRYLCQSLFLNKVAGLRSEKETLAQLFSYEICKIFKSTYLQSTSKRLLLFFQSLIFVSYLNSFQVMYIS